ncbi:MAG: DUF3526 domain-containing protein [Bacteroidota bacterium]
MDNYLRDHPEYALNDTAQARGFYHRYMASQKLIREELAPVVNAYEEQLQKQQDWVSRFKWISTAIIAQESLNEMAGTSTRDYEDYRKQAVNFAHTWQEHFMPFLYNNRSFSQKDYSGLPNFEYAEKKGPRTGAVTVLFLISCGLFGLGSMVSKNLRGKGILNQV